MASKLPNANSSIVPVYKKSDKRNIKNYSLVSLLPICIRIFEKEIICLVFSL